MNSDFYRMISLKARVTISTLTVFLICIWILAYYSSNILYERIKVLSGNHQLSAASIISAHVADDLTDMIRGLETVAGEIRTDKQAGREALQSHLEQRPLLLHLFNFGVFAVNMDGTAIADFPVTTGRIGINYLDRDHIRDALRNGKTVISKPVIGKKLRAAAFVIVVPIRNAAGNVIGALAGVTDLSKPNVLDKIAGNSYGKTGGYLLASRQHRCIITATDKSRIMKQLPDPGINPLLDRYMGGYEGFGVAVNSLGVEELTAAKNIPLADWFIIVKLPTTEAFEPIRETRRRILFAAFSLTLMAGIATWLILRRQFLPMSAAAESLAVMLNSDQPLQALTITRHDEIGQMIGGFNKLLATLELREKELRASEVMYRNILQSSMDGFWLADTHGSLLVVNDAYCDMSGYSRQELLSMNVTDLDSIKTQKEIFSQIQIIMEQGSDRFESRHNRRDGTVIDVEISIQFDSNENIMVCFIRDITARKNAEKAIQDAHAFTQSALDTITDIFYAFDDKSKFMLWNDTFKRISGYSDQELTLMQPQDFFLNADVQRISEAIQRTYEEGSSKVEAFFILKDGRQILCEFSGSTIKDSNDNIIGFAGTGRDITEYKLIQERLTEQRNLLTRQNRDLEAALLQVKQLEGIIPICSYCKKIRDDEESWHRIEDYIAAHSEALFSHGICPDCLVEQVKLIENMP